VATPTKIAERTSVLRAGTADGGPRALLGSWRNHLFALLLCVLLAFVFLLPGSLRPRSALLGYPGDNYQHAWFLWHFARAVSHAQNPFYTRLIYYPNKVNLAWSTTDPLAATLALPVSLSAGPTVAYNLSLVLQLALAAFFARLLCLRICCNEVAGFLGGAIFGFSPFLLAHALGHLSLVTAFPIPLFVLALDSALAAPRNSWKLGIALGASLLLTAMAHYNYTVFCCLFALVFVLTEVALKGRAVLARSWKTLLTAAATFSIGFLPLLRMLLGGPSPPPSPRGLNHIEQFSADALGFAIPSWNHVVLGHFMRSLGPRLFVAGFEGTVYVGPIVLALAILGAWKGRDSNGAWVVRAVVAGTIFYLLSLGPRIHLMGHELDIPGPASALYWIRFAEFISAPARFHVIFVLCLAILSSIGLAFLVEHLSAVWQRCAVISLIAALVLLDYLTIPFPRSSIVDPAAPSDVVGAQPCALPESVRGGTVLTFPLVIAPYCMKSMWMQACDGGGYALVDGYLSYSPTATWTEFWDAPVIRSLLSLEGILNVPVDTAADRARLGETVRKLNLKVFVVFDSPQEELAMRYGKDVFGGAGTRGGSCTVFEVKSNP
jgi:hypothetical protein